MRAPGRDGPLLQRLLDVVLRGDQEVREARRQAGQVDPEVVEEAQPGDLGALRRSPRRRGPWRRGAPACGRGRRTPGSGWTRCRAVPARSRPRPPARGRPRAAGRWARHPRSRRWSARCAWSYVLSGGREGFCAAGLAGPSAAIGSATTATSTGTSANQPAIASGAVPSRTSATSTPVRAGSQAARTSAVPLTAPTAMSHGGAAAAMSSWQPPSTLSSTCGQWATTARADSRAPSATASAPAATSSAAGAHASTPTVVRHSRPGPANASAHAARCPGDRSARQEPAGRHQGERGQADGQQAQPDRGELVARPVGDDGAQRDLDEPGRAEQQGACRAEPGRGPRAVHRVTIAGERRGVGRPSRTG